jgi:hypothetical protein
LGNFALSLSTLPPVFIRAAFNPFILLGIVCYGVSLLVWLVVLAKAGGKLRLPPRQPGVRLHRHPGPGAHRGSGDSQPHGRHPGHLPGRLSGGPQLRSPTAKRPTVLHGTDRLPLPSSCRGWRPPPLKIPASSV